LKDLDLDVIYKAYSPLTDPLLSLKDLKRLDRLSPKVFQQVQILATKFQFKEQRYEELKSSRSGISSISISGGQSCNCEARVKKLENEVA